MKGKSSKLEVLIVDDNDISRQLFECSLSCFDIKTKQASSGAEAILLCQSLLFDIIFVDHFMPVMDGIQTVKEIRSIYSNQHQPIIIALSSDDDNNLRLQYLRVGANDLYLKPLRQSQLIALLHQFKVPAPRDTISKKKKQQRNQKEILRASLKDLKSCINIMTRGYEDNSQKQLGMGLHVLKNIGINLNDSKLQEIVKGFEGFILDGELSNEQGQFKILLEKLYHYQKSLEDRIINMTTDSQNIQTEEASFLTDEEYEQSLVKTIYYIRRYEYELIVRELRYLLSSNHKEWKREFEAALKEIEDFQYEQALLRIEAIKKTGKLPISAENKLFYLDHIVD